MTSASRNQRASAINVSLPFRSIWPVRSGTFEKQDRAQIIFLYRGVFDGERWIPAPQQDEAWTEKSQQSEAWMQVAKASETWTAKTKQSEVWAEKPKAAEIWTQTHDD